MDTMWGMQLEDGVSLARESMSGQAKEKDSEGTKKLKLTVANDAVEPGLEEGHALLEGRNRVVATALGCSNGCHNQKSKSHQLEHC